MNTYRAMKQTRNFWQIKPITKIIPNKKKEKKKFFCRERIKD